MRIAASAPRRSRVIESTTTAVGSGERSKTQPASNAEAPNPATETATEKARSLARGTITAPRSVSAELARSASVGDSASQSTDGVSITGRALPVTR